MVYALKYSLYDLPANTKWKGYQESTQVPGNKSILKLSVQTFKCQVSDFLLKAIDKHAKSLAEHLRSTQQSRVDIPYRTQARLEKSYRKSLAGLLKQQGLRELSRHTILIKAVSMPVRSSEFSYVEA